MEAGSETSSFIRREAELCKVEECLRDSCLRKEPCIPIESKFHEVLSDNPRFADRNSLLSKLELILPMDSEIFMENFDGHGLDNGPLVPTEDQKSGVREDQDLCPSVLGHLKVPGDYTRTRASTTGGRLVNISDGSPRTRGFSSSRDGDETAEMWKRALRAESVPKSPRHMTSAHLIIPRPSRPEAKVHSQLPRAPCPSEIGAHSGSDSVVHSPTCTELPTPDDEEAFGKSLVRSNNILEQWGRQLENQEQEAKANDQALPSGSRSTYKKSRIPPASWARFPSHNREERNAAAGELDSIKPRDFAVREILAAGRIGWTTDKDEGGAPNHKSIVRTVSDRFTQPFKSRWSKLVPGRAGTQFKDRSIRGARRSSIQASGDLEYPELELLPTTGGYREILALEREINEMKGVIDPKMRSSSEKPLASDNRLNFVKRMTGGLQHDGSSDVEGVKSKDMAGCIEGQKALVRICVPATPATQTGYSNSDWMHARDLTDSSGERYATPLTHFSLSRPPTPQTASHPAVFTPGSAQSTGSVIRHTSLCVPKKALDLGMNVTQPDSSSGPNNNRRRSAPPVSPGFD